MSMNRRYPQLIFRCKKVAYNHHLAELFRAMVFHRGNNGFAGAKYKNREYKWPFC